MEPSGLYYPNRIARYFFLAMEEVMGLGGLNTVLSIAKLNQYQQQPPPDTLDKQVDFSELSALNAALEEVYGPRGGRGMALRIGRACFAMGMKNFGALAGMQDPAFRALSLDERCQFGLQALASVFNRFSDQRSSVNQDSAAYTFVVENSPMAHGRTSEKPVCHALAGIVQECMSWASNGYEFYVVETACRACGDERCTFQITRKPIGQAPTSPTT